MKPEDKALIRRARRNHARRVARGEVLPEPEFQRVVAKLVHAGVLVSNRPSPRPPPGPLPLSSYLKAGEREPRILEVLPAVVLKKPRLVAIDDMPDELAVALAALREHAENPPDFRGVPGAQYRRWVEKIGKKGAAPTRMKTLRLTVADSRTLENLRQHYVGQTDTEIIRAGLRELERHLSDE